MTYKPKHEPWDHQQMALDKMEGHEAFALLMAMRTGKTKVSLDDFGRLEDGGEVDDLLVIAPAGVYRTWETAETDHLSDDLLERGMFHTWSAGAGVTAQRELEAFLETRDPSRPRFLLVNVEALSVVKRAREMVKEYLDQRRVMTDVDESTAIKNPTAARTKFVLKEVATRSAYRRILSGLVAPRSPLDLYSQFEFLDPDILGYKSYFAFRNRFAIMKKMNVPGQRPFQIVVGYRDTDKLAKLIEPYSIRVRLEDCYDLPPKVYSIREVPLTDQQRRAYKEIKDNATTMLESGEHVTATMVITQMLRMHQVLCGHVGTEDGQVVEIPENRTRELIELLEEFEGKAIVWCSYDYDVKKVARRLEEEFGEGSVACFWGGNRSSREEEERRFKGDPDCRFMVATAAAGGRGRTWTEASLVVYYSNTADLEHRSQSEERPQGVGKEDSVAYVDLMVRGTVDEKFVKSLRNKIDMASVINGDNYREWLI